MNLKRKIASGVLGLAGILNMGCEVTPMTPEEKYQRDNNLLLFGLGGGLMQEGYDKGNPAAANIGNSMVNSSLQRPNQTNINLNAGNQNKSDRIEHGPRISREEVFTEWIDEYDHNIGKPDGIFEWKECRGIGREFPKDKAILFGSESYNTKGLEIKLVIIDSSTGNVKVEKSGKEDKYDYDSFITIVDAKPNYFSPGKYEYIWMINGKEHKRGEIKIRE